MNIETGNNVKIKPSSELKNTSTNKSDVSQVKTSLPPSFPSTMAETRQAIDKATGVLQTIITEELSEKIIRKMPSDEYLRLLNLVDNMVSGSIDKEV